MKLTIALFSIIFGLCLAQETKINWILKDSTLRTRCTLNIETSVFECDGPSSVHVKCNVRHNMTHVVPMKFEHFAIEYTPVEGTTIPAGLIYHLYPRQVEKNVWFSYNVTIPTVGEVSIGLFHELPTGFGIEIVDEVCGNELFKLLQASTEHEEIVVEGGVSEVLKVMVIGEIVVLPGSVVREESEVYRTWGNGWGRVRGGWYYRETKPEGKDEPSYAYRPIPYQRYYGRYREAEGEDSEDMMTKDEMSPRELEDSERHRGGGRRWRNADDEDSEAWRGYGSWRGGYGGWRGGYGGWRRWRNADDEDSEAWRNGYGGWRSGYGGWRGGYGGWRGRWNREIFAQGDYKYYRESMSTGNLTTRTRCTLRNESTIIECVGPVETVICDVVSNFTALGSNLYELYGIGEPFAINGELQGFHLYPRTLDNKQFLNYTVLYEGKEVNMCLFQKEEIPSYGIRVETPECFHKLHGQFNLAVKPEEILIENVPVRLVGEILV